MRVPEMFSDHRMFMLLNALMEVAASVFNIIGIAQITCDLKHYIVNFLDEIFSIKTLSTAD